MLLKQDLFFLPIMFIMFYIAYLVCDVAPLERMHWLTLSPRTEVPLVITTNARLTGLQEDLSLSNQ